MPDALAELSGADWSAFGSIATLKDDFAEALATATASDATLAESNAAALAAEQARNAAAYADATSAAAATYANAWRAAWNDAFLETLAETSAETSALDAEFAEIASAAQASFDASTAIYRDAILGAHDDFIDETLDVAKIYAYNEAKILAGGEVEPDAFENPTEDFEVCFVAGAQVLLADGSTKPIEQIRPGDKVLSSRRLTPEETPTSANVVRFFDVGEKEVVRLRFAAQETPIDATSQEIVRAPGRRFYVVGKGWVRAQDLQPGDLALSATGEKIAFVSRENLAEKRRVYNFEVEGKRAYFVGRGQYFVLAHNDCSYCGSDDWERLCFRNGAVYNCGWLIPK